MQTYMAGAAHRCANLSHPSSQNSGNFPKSGPGVPGPALALLAAVTHSSRLAYALLLTALTACGGKSFETDPNPDSGGSDPGGSGHGGSGSAGKGQGGSSIGGSSIGGSFNYAGMGPGGAGGTGSTCSEFDDARGTFMPVEIINKTSTVIYLGQEEMTCSEASLFQVKDAAGTPLAFPGGCQSTCQQLRTNGPIGCPAICAFPGSTAIQPGQAMYTTWNGLYQVDRELPRQCLVGDYGNVCRQTVQVQPGQFTFSAIAGRSIDCSKSSGSPCQACTQNENGCYTPGSLITGQILEAATTVTLGPAYGVYGSAAPAPAYPGTADPPGGGSGAAAPRPSIQIVFTDP